MKAERATYEALLEMLADGTPIDWTSVESQMTTAAKRRRYSNLRLVARLTELHRTLALEDELSNPTFEQPSPAAIQGMPERWGHLEIGERLASGAYGDVYRARDPHLDRDVALKLLRPASLVRGGVNRLLSEAQMLARVRHQNVVTVHGADVRDDRAGLWMELVDGRTLESWLETHGTLGAAEVTSVGEDLCRALSAVHAASLVHGDLKSHNVMRAEGGRIVLMDFGTGRAHGTEAAAGTPLYLAPEVLAGSPATAQSDIYSLGVLLFHLLSGRYPYAAASLDDLRAAHADGRRTLLRDLRPDLPGPLVHVVERALESDPARRFATAGQMEAALARSGGARAGKGDSSFGWLAIILSVIAMVAVAAAVAGRWRSAEGAAGTSTIKTVTVLPFTTAQAADAPPYLLDGLSLDLVRALQRFDVEVKRITGAAPPPPDSLHRISADAALRGSARRDGDKRLLDITVLRADGATLWTREYDLTDPEMPGLPRRIASDVATAMGVQPRAGAPQLPRTPDPRAYDAYLRGRLTAEQRGTNALERSVEYYRQAIALDPGYAEPWAGLADSYVELGVPAFGALSPLDSRRLAKEAALKALGLNPNLAEAETTLAFTAYFHDWNWSVAEQRFKRAIELNPQYALAHHWYADYLTAMDRPDEAMGEIARAQELEPLSTIIHRDVAWHLFFQRRYDEAIAHLNNTLQMDSAYEPARTLLARALAENGRYAEALQQLDRVQQPPSSAVLSFIAYVDAKSGNVAAARQTLGALRRQVGQNYFSPYYLALVYIALGDRETALTHLERSFSEQESTLVNVNVDPRFEPIRDDPRFVALVERLHFPPSQKRGGVK